MSAGGMPYRRTGSGQKRRVPVQRGRPVHTRTSAGRRSGRGRKIRKRTKVLDFLFGFIGAVLLVTGLVFAGLALKEKYPYMEAKAEYEKFRSEVADPLPDFDPDTFETEKENPDGSNPVSPYEQEVLSRGMDWTKMRYINQDIVAWITVPGTQIDYPVCQATDNEYYLSHNVYRASNALGAIFADSECSFTSDHPILYGHNMEEGQMFGELSFYESEAFWQQHPYVYLYTPEGCSRWAVASAFQTNDQDGLYLPDRKLSSDDYEELISELSEKAYYETGRPLSKDTKVLTLSTCADYGYEGDRFTVHLVFCDTVDDTTEQS